MIGNFILYTLAFGLFILVIVWICCKLPYERPVQIIHVLCEEAFLFKQLVKSLIQRIRIKILIFYIKEELSKTLHRDKAKAVRILNGKIYLEDLLEVNLETINSVIKKMKEEFRFNQDRESKELLKYLQNLK